MSRPPKAGRGGKTRRLLVRRDFQCGKKPANTFPVFRGFGGFQSIQLPGMTLKKAFLSALRKLADSFVKTVQGFFRLLAITRHVRARSRLGQQESQQCRSGHSISHDSLPQQKQPVPGVRLCLFGIVRAPELQTVQSIFSLKRVAFQTIRPVVLRKKRDLPLNFGMAAL